MNAGGRDRARDVSARGALLCSVVCACIGAPGAARAEHYTLDNTSDVRVEANDNVNLLPHSPGTVKTLAVSTTVNAARRAENSATLLGATVTALQQWGRGANDRLDGRVSITQSYDDALNTVSVSAQYTQDFNNTVQTADVTVNPGQRRTATVSASWGRALTERLSTSTQVDASETRYGASTSAVATSSDFRNVSVSTGLSYAVTEVDTVTAQLSHSEYRAASGGNRSSTNDISISASHALGERGSASLQIGVYQTDSSSPRVRFICPSAVLLCELGLVPLIQVRDRVQSSGTGLIYGATYSYQLNETSSLSFSLGSRQSPSGAGEVVQNRTLSLGLSHSFSETLSGVLRFAQSRASYQAATTARRSQQRSAVLSLSQRLSRDISLQSTYQWTESDNAGLGGKAWSNSIGVALKYDWPTLQVSR